MKYMYLTKDWKWKEHNKPLKGKQFGFFGTRKDGSYGELHWNKNTEVRRCYSRSCLFGWFHDNVPIPFWGDSGIFEISDKGEPLKDGKVYWKYKDLIE